MGQPIRMIHTIPGRTRFQLAFPGLSAPHVEACCRANPFIFSAVYSETTRTLLLYYDAMVSPKMICQYVRGLFSAGLAPEKRTAENTSKEKAPSPFKREAFNIALAMGTYLVDRLFFSGIKPAGIMRVVNPVALATFFAAGRILKDGFGSLIRDRKINADTLTAAAVMAAVVKGAPGSGLTIVTLSSLGELLTEYTANRTRSYITDVLKLDVPFVWKVDESGKETKVPIEHIQPGDRVAVFVGEKISVDGTVVDGIGSVDESSLTGEYLPKEVASGSFVYAGSVLKNGQIQITVKNVGDDTAITRMIRLIEDAQNKQAPIQSFADKMSQSLVPISFLMAGVVYLITRDWNRVMNMLFIDYACGLKLSTATAISAAIGKSAKQGILVKGGQFVERLAGVNTVVFDKTGTVTVGEPVVKQVYAFSGYSEKEIIALAASSEEHSSHPIATAVIKKAAEWSVEIPDHDEVETLVGLGVRSTINGKDVRVGSDVFMTESGVEPRFPKAYESLGQEPNLMYVAEDQKLIGAISYSDPVRPGMKRTINQLRRYGIDEIVLLTGDKRHNAQKIANKLFLDNFYAEALPEDKAAVIKGYRNNGNRVMMVGDGINDAAALAFSDIGITLGGKRTDIAVETSDVIITGDDPMALSKLIQVSQGTMKVIRQNFMTTIIVNSLAMLLGAIGTVTPVVAAVIHNVATIGVVLNSSKILVARN